MHGRIGRKSKKGLEESAAETCSSGCYYSPMPATNTRNPRIRLTMITSKVTTPTPPPLNMLSLCSVTTSYQIVTPIKTTMRVEAVSRQAVPADEEDKLTHPILALRTSLSSRLAPSSKAPTEEVYQRCSAGPVSPFDTIRTSVPMPSSSFKH